MTPIYIVALHEGQYTARLDFTRRSPLAALHTLQDMQRNLSDVEPWLAVSVYDSLRGLNVFGHGDTDTEAIDDLDKKLPARAAHAFVWDGCSWVGYEWNGRAWDGRLHLWEATR